jgi:tRNA(Ile)-lysidine synthase TilS/MesJ
MIYDQVRQQVLPILSSDKNIGILASGGVDSSVLLFVCLLLIQQHRLSTKFRVFNVPSHDGSVQHAMRIVKWMNRRFGSKLNITLVGNPDLHHSKQVLSGLLEAKNECDHLLLGDTTNPPHIWNGPERVRSPSDRYIQPFFDFTKKDTVKLAYDMGFHEVAELTHSCSETSLVDTKRCNHCWMCRERAWAFEANGITDTGTM